MALAFANFKRMPPVKGGWRMGFVDITFDASYTTGGWAVAASDLKLGTIHVLVPPATRSGFVLEWDHVNAKINAYQEQDSAGAMKEIDASDLSAVVARCWSMGW